MTKENDVKKYIQFYNTAIGKKILEHETRIIDEKLMGRKKVLSIGCGPAVIEERLHQLRPEMNIMGLDKSKEMIQQTP